MSSTANQNKFRNEQIQYVEFLSKDIQNIKRFYTNCFDWVFTDYGPDYTAFEGDYMDGGFTTGTPLKGSVLIILYSKDIETTKKKIMDAGGIIVQDIFSFPGGKRFHFVDPDGNELAIWSA